MSEWTFSFDELVEVNFDAPGVPGRKGDPGEGLPSGGTTGQFARKASATDYDTEWVDVDATTVGADSAGSAAAAQAAAIAAAQSYADGVSAADRVYIDNEIAGLAPVASSGAYSDLTGRPTLGTAAAQNTTAFATAAQGAKADTAIQDDDLGTSAYLDVPATGNALTTQVVKGNDSRLTNARPPTAHTHDYEAAGAVAAHEAAHAPSDAITAAQHALIDHTGLPGVGGGGDGAVDSVNGEIGAVVLDAADVGAAAASHSHSLSDVTDSGGAAALEVGTTAGTVAAGDHAHTGVYATAAQGSLADSAVQPADNANTLGSGAATDGHVLTADGAGGAAWEAVPAAPVTSVNGETGVVVLDNTDVGAAATSHTHTESDITDLGDYAVSSHNHDSDYAAADLLTSVTTNAQTGTTYTLVLADAGKLVTLSNAAAITATVPPNSSVAFPIGTRIALLQLGAGQVTVAQGSGVTVNTAETLKLADQFAPAELLKTATDTWVLFGRLEAA